MSERPTVWGELPPDGTVLTHGRVSADGGIDARPGADLRHAARRGVAALPAPELLLELAVLMRVFVGQHKLGTVCIAPQDVILDPARALILQPDLMFISKARQRDHQRSHLGRAGPGGRSDVAASAHRQARQNASATSRNTACKECWLIHQLSREIEVLRLQEHGATARRTVSRRRAHRIERAARLRPVA